MYYLHVSSNIMSLGGLALAIGVLVDAAIVMVENGYRHLSEAQRVGRLEPTSGASRANGDDSAGCRQTGWPGALLFAADHCGFVPAGVPAGSAGRTMFRPLAWTKTLAVGFSSLLAITLVPVLMLLFIRGRLRPESQNPDFALHAGDLSAGAALVPALSARPRLLLNLRFLAVTLPLAFELGSQFMPPLFEGSSLYMPTALPGISIAQASQLMQEQDRIIRSFPEVESVFGSVGRSDSATDNAPLDMYDTTVMFKPREQWRRGMTYEKLIPEMDAKLQFPGLSNTWTMPVENRLDMELTGIKTPVGHQDPGAEPGRHPASRSADSADSLGACPKCGPSLRSASRKDFTSISKSTGRKRRATADRRRRAARDHSGIGGENIAENVEGPRALPDLRPLRARLPGQPRRAAPGADRTPSGAQIPHRRSREGFVFARSRDDPRRRRRADRLRVSST